MIDIKDNLPFLSRCGHPSAHKSSTTSCLTTPIETRISHLSQQATSLSCKARGTSFPLRCMETHLCKFVCASVSASGSPFMLGRACIKHNLPFTHRQWPSMRKSCPVNPTTTRMWINSTYRCQCLLQPHSKCLLKLSLSFC